jgi:hypothetical protein
MSTRISTFLILGLSAAIYLVWGAHYADFDLWWDELDSLTEYALVDFGTTVTKYPYPNNHILFNLVSNAVTRLWGVRDIYRIMDQVEVLRWIQWVLSAGTLFFLFRAARNRLSSNGAALAVLLAVTSLPFLNFVMQLRGYALSMLFVAGLLCWCALPRSAGRSLTGILMTAIFTFALLYTVPSNVYFALALSAVVLIRLLASIRMDPGGEQGADRLGAARVARNLGRNATGASSGTTRRVSLRAIVCHRDFWLLAALAVGTMAAFLAYLPVLDQLLHNRFVTDTPANRWFVLSNRLPEVLHHFLSGRYLLPLLILPGLYWGLTHRGRFARARSNVAAPTAGHPQIGGRFSDSHSGDPHPVDGGFEILPERNPFGNASRSTIVTLLALGLVPFLLSFLRNDVPFQRTFILLAPVYALLFAVAIEEFRNKLSRGTPGRLAAWMPFWVALYSAVTTAVMHVRLQDRLEEALVLNRREQNIYANFYQASGFRPLDAARALAAELNEKPGLVLMANELDRVAWTFYLQKFDVPSYALAQFVEDRTPTSTHGGVYQLSQGRSGERTFLQWTMTIEEPFEKGDRLTPLMLYVSKYDPADRIYVLTGFSDLIERVLRTRYPEVVVERIDVPGSYGLFRLTRTDVP